MLSSNDGSAAQPALSSAFTVVKGIKGNGHLFFISFPEALGQAIADGKGQEFVTKLHAATGRLYEVDNLMTNNGKQTSLSAKCIRAARPILSDMGYRADQQRTPKIHERTVLDLDTVEFA